MRYCNNANLLFLELWKFLTIPILSMFICMQKKKTSSFTLFLRYCILKNPAIWLAVLIWELEFCQIWDWWWNISNNISFHFRLFPRKTKDKIVKISEKKPILGKFGPFLPKLRQKWIFREKRALSVFKCSSYVSSCQKSEKTIEKFLRKTPNWWTDRQTDNSDFIRPSVGTFLGIICLVNTQSCSKTQPLPLPLVCKCMHLRTPSHMHMH